MPKRCCAAAAFDIGPRWRKAEGGGEAFETAWAAALAMAAEVTGEEMEPMEAVVNVGGGGVLLAMLGREAAAEAAAAAMIAPIEGGAGPAELVLGEALFEAAAAALFGDLRARSCSSWILCWLL